MAEYQDPPLRLTVEAMRWMGEQFEPLGTSAAMQLYGTDSNEDAAVILRALRRILSRRLSVAIPLLALSFADLDFDAPNAPTEDDVAGLLTHAERIVENLRALKEVSPEVIDDDDDEDHGCDPDMPRTDTHRTGPSPADCQPRGETDA